MDINKREEIERMIEERDTINETYSINNFYDFVTLKSKRTQSFEKMNVYNHFDLDDEVKIYGYFCLSLDEVSKITQDNYLEELNINENDYVRFDFLITIQLDKKKLFTINYVDLFTIRNVILVNEDYAMQSILYDIINKTDYINKLKKQFFKRMKKEKPLEVLLSETDSQVNQSIMDKIKNYNKHQ